MQKKCEFCGSSKNIRSTYNHVTCQTCRPILYAVKNHPATVEKAWPMFHDYAILPQARQIKIPWKSELPEELDGKRYKTVDREANAWYLLVTEYEQKPVEVFASTAMDNKFDLQSRIANLTALTRLVSLILRHIFLGERLTFTKVKNQLRRSSRQKNDLPDMLRKVLKNYE